MSKKEEDFAELNSLGRENVRQNNKVDFGVWCEKFNVNKSALAENLGMTRQSVYNLINKENNASLSTALAIYYMSGGLVDMFSLLMDGDALKHDLREYIRLTHSQNRTKIKRMNQLKRYNLRKL